MKKTLSLLTLIFGSLIMAFTIAACMPQAISTPLPVVVKPTSIPAATLPAETDPTGTKSYTNSMFGVSFQFPANWFGPEEYISNPELRVEIGSDKVYPYGTGPEERTDALTNSYNVVIQYSKNSQNEYWKDVYQSLLALQDGESLSDTRGMLIRVRQFNLGRFEGIEYISTLSETAQTDPAYARSVILLDRQTNDLLTLVGQPINVEVGDSENWRYVYRMIDEANQAVFHQIVDSITIQ